MPRRPRGGSPGSRSGTRSFRPEGPGHTYAPPGRYVERITASRRRPRYCMGGSSSDDMLRLIAARCQFASPGISASGMAVFRGQCTRLSDKGTGRFAWSNPSKNEAKRSMPSYSGESRSTAGIGSIFLMRTHHRNTLSARHRCNSLAVGVKDFASIRSTLCMTRECAFPQQCTDGFWPTL